MALDCLLVTRDPQVRRMFSTLLGTLGIELKECPDVDKAEANLRSTKYDSVVVDCVDFEKGSEVLRGMRQNTTNAKSIAFAITPKGGGKLWSQTGAHFVLEKPLSLELTARTFRAARDLMVQERRRYFRYKASFLVEIVGMERNVISATNISGGGMAVTTSEPLQVGFTGKLQFKLPVTNAQIVCKGEVVWVRDKQAGIRFAYLPTLAQEKLEEWCATQAEETSNV